MKLIMIAGTLILFTTAGTAAGSEPWELNTAQLDRVTAGADGTVKWFNDSKGFGFITPDSGSNSERPVEGVERIIFGDGSVLKLSWSSLEIIEISPPASGESLR
jgi:hypothetical protein